MLRKDFRILPTSIGVFSVIVAMLIAVFAVDSQAASTETSNCSVVLLGASYARGWPIARIGDFPVINKGIGGNQSFEMAKRFHTDVVKQNADTVILWGFINDIFRAPQEQLEDARRRIIDSYSQMITLAKENGIRPIIATEVSIREPKGLVSWAAGVVGRLRGKTSYQTIINGYVTETNEELRKLAATHNVEVLDFFSVLADDNGLRRSEFATEDGSHITTAAYDELTKYVSKNFPFTCRSKD